MGMVFTMIKELQFLLKNSENIDSALIVSPENRRYFTEFPSSDGFLLVTRDDAVFITDSRYIEAAGNKVTECKTALQKREISQVYDFFKSNGAEKVGIEASRMTVSELAKFDNALKDINIDFSGEPTIIHALRMVKSESEIEKIKKAQKIAEGAFDDMCGLIKPGVTEKATLGSTSRIYRQMLLGDFLCFFYLFDFGLGFYHTESVNHIVKLAQKIYVYVFKRIIEFCNLHSHTRRLNADLFGTV